MSRIRTVVSHPDMRGFYYSEHCWNDPIFALEYGRRNGLWDFRPIVRGSELYNQLNKTLDFQSWYPGEYIEVDIEIGEASVQTRQMGKESSQRA